MSAKLLGWECIGCLRPYRVENPWFQAEAPKACEECGNTIFRRVEQVDPTQIYEKPEPLKKDEAFAVVHHDTATREQIERLAKAMSAGYHGLVSDLPAAAIDTSQLSPVRWRRRDGRENPSEELLSTGQYGVTGILCGIPFFARKAWCHAGYTIEIKTHGQETQSISATGFFSGSGGLHTVQHRIDVTHLSKVSIKLRQDDLPPHARFYLVAERKR